MLAIFRTFRHAKNSEKFTQLISYITVYSTYVQSTFYYNLPGSSVDNRRNLKFILILNTCVFQNIILKFDKIVS